MSKLLKTDRRKILRLFLSFVFCFGASVAGSFFTTPNIAGWYAGLAKPVFNPPSWLFGPVWTLLYALMAVALYLIWRDGLKKKENRVWFSIFLFHLFVNALWSVVFFSLHSLAGAFLVLVVLWSLILFLIGAAYRLDKKAAYLLMPYLAWVTFAGILNFTLYFLNR